MDSKEVMDYFNEMLEKDPGMSEAVAAIRTLLELLRRTHTETLYGLREELNCAMKILTCSDHKSLVTAIRSGGELFLRFITLCALDNPDFKQCKNMMIERGDLFLTRASRSRDKIAHLAHPFITDGMTILTHSRSRVVLELLKTADCKKKRFKVYVTESMPDSAGKRMCQDLIEAGIDAVLILDAAVGYIMEKVDAVLFGAEGVVESGGIINKIGTCTIAICAKEMHKPVYVVAESFKFTRLYPLSQQDVPKEFKYRASVLAADVDLNKEHPMVDYTPPAYLTLLFTDLGILTPSAVSDELIKLYV